MGMMNQGSGAQFNIGDNQSINFNINIGLNFQASNIKSTVQNQGNGNGNGSKLERKAELDDLLNELDNNEISNS